MTNPPAPLTDHDPEIPILVTGASGFLGARVVHGLIQKGFRNIRCQVRASSALTRLSGAIAQAGGPGRAQIVSGDLLSREDCARFAEGIGIVYHLAAGTGTKAFSDAYLNSVVTTRNLLDAALRGGRLRRFVNISSFAVYTNRHKPRRGWLDESCPVETDPATRAEAYGYGKVKQDELVRDYGERYALPYVIIRPGNIFGPGKGSIPGRVGIDSFGPYLHFGGSNPIPLSYVDNCAEAVILAGLAPGIEGQVFNVVDDDLPSSRRYLKLYKKHVRRFRSIYIPHALSYLFCLSWEWLAAWSRGQLPAVFSRREWTATWKRTRYSNAKIKELVGWAPRVPMDEGLRRFFESLAP